MTVDMSQFYQTFLEESFEGLDTMESCLLNLDVGDADIEAVNTIFRAAHSIKGGAATFGFDEVAEFTHVVETLLDQIRSGERPVEQNLVDYFLQSVDCLRTMLHAVQSEAPVMTDDVRALMQALEAALGGEHVATVESSTSDAQTTNSDGSGGQWSIQFSPHATLMKTGNDPVRILRELSSLGDMTAMLDVTSLPVLSEIDPEVCYLKWTIDLNTDAAEADIAEVFEWVSDDCDLQINSSMVQQSSEQSTAPVSHEKKITPDAEAPENGLDIVSLETSFKLLQPQANELAKRFYETLFLRYPQVKELFKNTSIEQQQGKLIAALQTVMQQIREPEKLADTVFALGQRHQNYGAEKDHYALVGETLIYVMADMAGEHWTSKIEQAWRQALSMIAEIMLSAYSTKTPVASDKVTDAKPSGAAPAPAKPSVTSDKNTASTAPKMASGESGSIRVSTDKIDGLINMVGELVITQSMLGQLGEDMDMSKIEKLRDGLAQLERNTHELQKSVMQIRMLPISFAFQRFPRMVRDLQTKLGKQIELKLSGEQTELDKTVMEKIGDPLVHLVRNSVDHGIELPAERVKAGKPEKGVVHLDAYHQGGNIVIEINDDGAGLNKERILEKARSQGVVGADEELTDERIYDLIFQPGFSTAAEVSDVSGRGVGMDVVKRNIRELGGSIEVSSQPGVGSSFKIRLPLTLAILDGQLVRVGNETYIIPLVSIIESLQVKNENVNAIAGQAELYKLREEYIPIMRLYEVFDVDPDSEDLTKGLLVVVEGDGQRAGVFVDDLLGQQQVVIKSLETNFKRIEGISGATILGDGTVALILDVGGIVKVSQNTKGRPKRSKSAVDKSKKDLDEKLLEISDGANKAA